MPINIINGSIPASRVNNIWRTLACMVDAYENCTCKCLNYYSIFIAITIGKPCFKSIKAIIGAHVVTPFKIINV